MSGLTHWLVEGVEPVDNELAQARARICKACPLNVDEGLYEDLVGLAAALVQRALQLKHDRELKVAGEEELHICDACGCNLALKIHAPISVLFKDGQPNYFDRLDANCWLRTEKP